jgi:hypothetical protein
MNPGTARALISYRLARSGISCLYDRMHVMQSPDSGVTYVGKVV